MKWSISAILNLFNELKKKEKDLNRVLQQRNLFQSRAKNIEDSLKYAQRIQKAMFTTPREMRQLFPDSFIFQADRG